jgi:hypothetical protein
MLVPVKFLHITAMLHLPPARATSRAVNSSRSSRRPALQYREPHGGIKMKLHRILECN